MELLRRIERRAVEESDRPAVVDECGTRTTTYGQLWELICEVSDRLLAGGLSKGDRVMVNMGRRVEYVACELGIIRAGGCVVPVVPEYPQGRIDYIRSDSGAVLALDDAFADGLRKARPEADRAATIVEHDPNDRALILYTSGSTGRPKGVVFTVGVIDYPIANNHSSSKLVDEIRWAAIAPMSFVASLAEYFNVLSNGGCSYIIDEKTRGDLGLLERFYADNRITVAFLPPRLLPLYKNGDADLKLVNTGSERLSEFYTDEFKVTNNYGQTETGGTVCTFVLDKAYETTPIGKPRKGIEIRLLGEDGEEVPCGEHGEICAIGMFPREYLSLPEQTAATFAPLDDGRVMVRTGDIGYMREDGNYVYVNRKD